ncbi:MAG: FAD binding domain-containing protein [Pseudomonadota bacterium]
MAYFAPQTLDETYRLLTRPSARVLAGGTDFFAAMPDGPIGCDIVDITRINALASITQTPDGGWRIGACVTWSDVVNADLPPVFDGLKAAARDVGAIQIQNTATLAGNLCNASPAADGVPPLLTLNAQVELTAQDGVRRIPLGDFITGPRQTALQQGELLTAILVAPHAPNATSAFVKLGARRYLVISIAMVAAVLIPDESGRVAQARVAVGACSAVAQRLTALETALIGAPLADTASMVRQAHVAPLTPIDDVRGSAAYRTDAAQELIRRALIKASPAS